MCPTFLLPVKIHVHPRPSQRHRAALELRFNDDPLRAEELDAALSNCLSLQGVHHGNALPTLIWPS